MKKQVTDLRRSYEIPFPIAFVDAVLQSTMGKLMKRILRHADGSGAPAAENQ